ncbi:MAG: NifB/NifX family molybdenum-iron cluster-binding protein [Methanomassiliicoccales archaeon]|nr:NifB/NifX family molybdenum-iron cluster-binding protein [Methanomassiliicoccales archaeon]
MTEKRKTVSEDERPCRMAVTSKGDNLQGEIAPMARSSFFIIFEGDPKHHLVMENLIKKSGSESGIKVASELAKQDIDIVITGTIGPKAFKKLEEAGVKVHAGCEGKVSEVLDKCLKGKLPICKKATYGGYLGI